MQSKAMDQPVRIPIDKYSSPVSASPQASETHRISVTGDGLYLSFETSTLGMSLEKCLRILHKEATLEFIELENLCRYASVLVEEARLGKVQVLVNQLPIVVRTRPPRMLFTYETRDRARRQFQVLFSSDICYNSAYETLSGLQCPIFSSSPRPASVQENSSSEHSTSQLQTRPATASSASHLNSLHYGLPTIPSDQIRATNQEMELGQPQVRPSTAPFPFRFESNSQNLPPRRDFSILSRQPSSSGQNFARPTSSNTNVTNSAKPTFGQDNSQSFQPSASSSQDRPTVSFPNSETARNRTHESPQPSRLLRGESLDAYAIPKPFHPQPATSQKDSSHTTPIFAGQRRAISQEESTFAAGNLRTVPSVEPGELTDSQPLEVLQNERIPYADGGRKGLMETGASGFGTASCDVETSLRRRSLEQISEESSDIQALRAYANMPSSRRQWTMDEVVSRYINDDAFLTLCEDVEKYWRRIGLDREK